MDQTKTQLAIENDPTSEFEIEYDALSVGIAIGYEFSDQSNFNFQAGYESISYEENTMGFRDDDYTFYALSYQRRLSRGIWLNVDLGSTEERAALDAGENEYLKFSFSYDIAS